MTLLIALLQMSEKHEIRMPWLDLRFFFELRMQVSAGTRRLNKNLKSQHLWASLLKRQETVQRIVTKWTHNVEFTS